MKIEKTFTADIYIGTKQGYEGQENTLSPFLWLQDFCDDVGFAVTIEKLDFIYTDGSEKGYRIGLINYPRFPSKPEEIKENAIHITKELMKLTGQERASIVCSDVTILIESDEF